MLLSNRMYLLLRTGMYAVCFPTPTHQILMVLVWAMGSGGPWVAGLAQVWVKVPLQKQREHTMFVWAQDYLLSLFIYQDFFPHGSLGSKINVYIKHDLLVTHFLNMNRLQFFPFLAILHPE